MKRHRIFAIGLVTAALGLGIVPAAHAADVVVTGDRVVGSGTTIRGDLEVRQGDATVAEGAVITGDLIVRDGNARVFGTVRGNVRQSGPGGVSVGEAGRVHGGVIEVSGGSVSVSGKVLGPVGVIERDAGDVTVRGQVEKVDERGDGTVRVRDGIYSEVRGSIMEFDAGDVIVFLKSRDGDVVERGSVGYIIEKGTGGIIVLGEVRGNVREVGEGDLSLRETALVAGNAVESEAGDVLVYDGSQVEGTILETGDGQVVNR